MSTKKKKGSGVSKKRVGKKGSMAEFVTAESTGAAPPQTADTNQSDDEDLEAPLAHGVAFAADDRTVRGATDPGPNRQRANTLSMRIGSVIQEYKRASQMPEYPVADVEEDEEPDVAPDDPRVLERMDQRGSYQVSTGETVGLSLWITTSEEEAGVI